MGRVKDHYHDQIMAQAEQQEDQQMAEQQGDRHMADGEIEIMNEQMLEEQMNLFLVALIVRQKEKMASRNLSRFRFDIEASGGCGDRGFTICFKVGESYDSTNAVSGSLIAAVEEHCRRRGWSDKNERLQITDGQIKLPDPLPVPRKDDPVF